MQAASINPSVSAKRVIPIVPYHVKGRYRSIKSWILIVAYAVYFTLPWLTWTGDSRVGQPILFDLATLRINFFDLVIFPQNLIILVSILIVAVGALFITASLYGRVFCGFFCFQTVWTDAFRFIERAVQGEAQARLRLRKQAFDSEKLAKLGITHLLWLLLSFATALTFTLYFWEAAVLFQAIFSGKAPAAAYIAVVTITLATYIAAGLAREQVCLVACPYGKFQTAMQDKHTLAVTYDQERGERVLGRAAPRSELKPAGARAEKGYGDCISCNYCVNVCPTGVDIRKGFQIDCISCGLCVDACNTIMDSMQLPRGLIKFTREETSRRHQNQPNLITLGYASLMAIMVGFILYTANHIEPFEAAVQHYAQPLVTRMANGDLRNRYIVRITNKTTTPQEYALTVEGIPSQAVSGTTQMRVPAGKTYTQTFNVVLPEETARNTEKLKLILIQQGRREGIKTFDLNYYSRISASS